MLNEKSNSRNQIMRQKNMNDKEPKSRNRVGFQKSRKGLKNRIDKIPYKIPRKSLFLFILFNPYGA